MFLPCRSTCRTGRSADRCSPNFWPTGTAGCALEIRRFLQHHSTPGWADGALWRASARIGEPARRRDPRRVPVQVDTLKVGLSTVRYGHRNQRSRGTASTQHRSIPAARSRHIGVAVLARPAASHVGSGRCVAGAAHDRTPTPRASASGTRRCTAPTSWRSPRTSGPPCRLLLICNRLRPARGQHRTAPASRMPTSRLWPAARTHRARSSAPASSTSRRPGRGPAYGGRGRRPTARSRDPGGPRRAETLHIPAIAASSGGPAGVASIHRSSRRSAGLARGPAPAIWSP